MIFDDTLRRDEVAVLARLLARAGITVTFSNAWQSDVRKKTITMPSFPYYYRDEVGLLLHEAGHIRFTGNVTETYKPHAHLLVNGLEDRRVNEKLRGAYKGAREYLDEMIHSHVSDLLRAKTPQLLDAIPLAVAMMETASFEEVATWAGAEARAFLEKHRAILEPMPVDETTEDMVERMLPAIRDYEALIEQEKAQHNGSLGYSTVAMHGDIDGLARTVKGNPASTGGNGSGGKGHENVSEVLATETLKGLVEQYTGYFAKTIAKIREREAVRYGGMYESGKIETPRLHKLTMGLSTRPFSRRVATDMSDDVIFSVVGDVSGSMERWDEKSGTIYTDASVASTIAFARACRMVGKECHAFVFGKRTERLGNDITLARDTAKKANDADTWLGTAVLTAWEAIKDRPARNKRIVIFTDGQPAHGEDDTDGVYKRAKIAYDHCFSTAIRHVKKHGGRVDVVPVMPEGKISFITQELRDELWDGKDPTHRATSPDDIPKVLAKVLAVS